MSRGILRRVAGALALAVLLVSTVGCSAGRDSSSEQVPPLTVRALKVGKADAILLQEGDHVMVIDTGEEDDGAEVVENLTGRAVHRVDVLVITHFDKDHTGGADTLLESMPVDRILVPDYDGKGGQYREFLAAAEAAGITPERVNGQCTFSLGSCEVLVDGPDPSLTAGATGETDNDLSLITTVRHGQNVLLFMGDAESLRIRQWLKEGEVPDCDLLKVPHHGVYENALAELTEAVTPAYALICDSDKNPADSRTLELLKNCGAEVRETRFGDITVTSDGDSLSLTPDSP